jgi:arylsulfatase A-like enzyme
VAPAVAARYACTRCSSAKSSIHASGAVDVTATRAFTLHSTPTPPTPRTRFRTYAPDDMPERLRRDGEAADFPPHTRAHVENLRGFTESDWATLRALYYGGVSFMDHSIGRLLDGIEAKLDMANTIVVYLSDHGELLGDHGLAGKSAYHYDGGIRVPLICRWDGHWPAGERREQIVEQTDLIPTLLDAAGVAAPPMDGQSFAPLLATPEQFTARDHAFVASYGGGPEDPTPDPVTWARTIRSEQYRVTFYADPDVGECFDLHADPHELHNRWRDPAMAAVITEHRTMLVSRLILQEHPHRARPWRV